MMMMMMMILMKAVFSAQIFGRGRGPIVGTPEVVPYSFLRGCCCRELHDFD
jgi:hypothetical protein